MVTSTFMNQQGFQIFLRALEWLQLLKWLCKRKCATVPYIHAAKMLALEAIGL